LLAATQPSDLANWLNDYLFPEQAAERREINTVQAFLRMGGPDVLRQLEEKVAKQNGR
jgi:hypothetical protein